MNRSETIVEIAKALCKFQEECPAPKKTATNPHFKSSYAPLEEIINTARPHLAKNGLSVVQSTSTNGDSIGVTTLILHSSGEFIELDTLWLPMGKATAQGAGSSITYARRYGYCAALNIAAEDDDDGNGASQDTKPQQPFNNTKQMASDKQLNLITKLVKDVSSVLNTSEQNTYKALKKRMNGKEMEFFTIDDASKAIAILQGELKQGA
ncbi:ERF family protein [Bacillus sp. FJAT-49736]|uniref:ERF family protein n=1 Tax=Bacillus sp. FJAT-49736 TaxID=2833582 RepID=UPI001BC9747A|nr:ERF family protein [Bacillus sp. FJAT-49736]MBS4173508.1 ERF family protein [Bacillus sp. FJAT-49736]